MDTLTHALLGAAVGAARLPRSRPPDEATTPARALVLAGVAAALLPDIDYLIPAADPVLHTLKAHRGLTHALVAAPVVALVATGLVKALFRRASLGALYPRALIAVPVAHLLPDLWTGWGTRVLLPFSDQRLALDWTMVVDPLFTAPLVVAALWGWRRRVSWRRALAAGVAVSAAYLGARIVLGQHLESVVRAEYPQAARVDVFPAPLALLRWRYVVTFEGRYAAGSVTAGSAVEEQAQVEALGSPVPERVAAIPTVREALQWARFPVVSAEPLDGGHRVRVADLRYHLRGRPTLTFVIDVGADLAVTAARLDRGGSATELLRRWRGGEVR